uniref:Uncharacterized protein n=1 Tax=Fusarium oxysporum (strain Fo5176) TaxID=660025 RepID=A0A0D2Y1B3_FUSOF
MPKTMEEIPKTSLVAQGRTTGPLYIDHWYYGHLGLMRHTSVPLERSSPFAKWRFGEMKSGDVTSTAEIADTGSTYRALLPYMKEESRTSLEHYTGPGLLEIEVHDSKYSESMTEYKNFALIQALLGYSPQGGWAMTNYKDLYEEDWIACTMVLLQFKTRASSLGNAWQATAQVVSTETRAAVEEASAVRDKEVEAWARSSVFPEGRAL